MSRFLICLTIVAGLAVASRLYSAILNPLTSVVVSTGPELHAAETSIRAPALFEQQAMDVFPDAPWTHHAEHTWQIAQSVSLYFRELHRIAETGNTVKISPVAILWRDPKRPDAPPYRMMAERAQVKFQNSFFDDAISLTDAKPGRIVWASLEGAVHIDGPDGLRIEGQNFKFEEEALQLYSDYPIEFAFGPTPTDQRTIAGTAHQIELKFQPSTDPNLNRDMPRIGGLAQVQLRRNVTLDSSFQQQNEPRHIRLTSEGSLRYDVVKAECVIDDQVHIVHQALKNQVKLTDVIDCDWLRLQFVPKTPVIAADGMSLPPQETSPQEAFDNLQLKAIQAKGTLQGKGGRLKITSEDQQMSATMQDLFYDAVSRHAVLIDQEQVSIQRGDMTFKSPFIDFQHTETNELAALECRGAGQLEIRQESLGPLPLRASWAQRLRVLPDPAARCHAISLERDTQVEVPNRGRLKADLFTLWVDLAQASTHGPRSPQITQTKATNGGSLHRPLALKRVRAQGNLTLDSTVLQITRANLVDAVITPGIIEATQMNRGSNSMMDPNGGQSRSDSAEADPWIVEADQLQLDLVHDTVAGALDFRQVVGEGSVQLKHQPRNSMAVGSRDMQGPLVISGRKLIAENGGGFRQYVTVLGESGPAEQEPAQAVVSFGPAKLWGGKITLSRHENLLRVPGPGGLSSPIPDRATGQAGSNASKLDVIWSEGMQFDGLAMRCWGKITASMPRDQESISRLLCEDLTAVLNQRLSFSDPASRTADLTIETLKGQHHVVMEAFEFQNRSVSAVRSANLASFEVHQSTGEFHGQGPGEIHSWTLGDKVRFAPADKSEANKPVTPSQSKWRYSGVKFQGHIEGNWNLNEATLNDRVQAITAPVDQARMKFHQNQLSENTPEAENAVWMKCQQLRLVRRLLSDGKTGMLEVFATGATELEGHIFRANADELTYDERSGQFVLRGLGRDAILYHQPEIGLPSNTSAARRIQFNPAKRAFNIGGSSGLNGGF